MKIICAWCNKTLTEYESPKNMVSHGICADCLRGLVGEGTVVNLRDFLDRLEFPVLVTDGSVKIQRANRMAERAFGRLASEMENATVGFAIECLSAQAPGECGRSGNCAGCALRQTIMDTNADGQPRYGIYSENSVLTPNGATPKRFRFSTTQIGNAVILAIEEIEDLPATS
jgi:PAS domain-containing protein